MPKAEIHPERADHVRIQTSYQDRFLIKQLPGVRYDSDTRTWTAPLTWATCIQLRGLFGKELELSKELADWGWNERNTRIEPAMALRTAMELSDDDQSEEAKIVRSWR